MRMGLPDGWWCPSSHKVDHVAGHAKAVVPTVQSRVSAEVLRVRP
jgi:hypothetical protein